MPGSRRSRDRTCNPRCVSLPARSCRERVGAGAARRIPKNFGPPLESKTGFFYFSAAAERWRSRRLVGRETETGTGRVRCRSYPFCSLEDLAMRTYGVSPLCRSSVGFDRLFDLVETAQRAGEDNYPPYNIERLGEDSYQISLAIAGFFTHG